MNKTQTDQSDDSRGFQYLLWDLSGDPPGDSPGNSIMKQCSLSWIYNKDGKPLTLFSCYPKAVQKEYLKSIEKIKELSLFVNKDTEKNSPIMKQLSIWKIKNDILKYWIYKYHKVIKGLKLPALIDEVEISDSENFKDSTEIKQETKTIVTHDNYRTVHYLPSGKTYEFTPLQAEVIRILHEAFKKGVDNMTQGEILKKCKSNQYTLGQIFGYKKHSAWNNLIIGLGNGVYRLNL